MNIILKTDDLNKRLDPLLEEWGDWSQDNLKLGYPNRSVEGRLQDTGGVLSRGSSPYVPSHIEIPVRVEIVDEAIRKLINDGFTRHVDAIRLRFILRHKYLTDDDRAKRMKIPLNTYRNHLRVARSILYGMLWHHLH